MLTKFYVSLVLEAVHSLLRNRLHIEVLSHLGHDVMSIWQSRHKLTRYHIAQDLTHHCKNLKHYTHS
jgi:hypothetical protein